jgi:glycosyltransferase involved in cell wall biosynthesis
VTRIAIDYTPAYEQGGGIGRYVRELVSALARHDTQTDYRLFVSGTGQKPLPPNPGPNFAWRTTTMTPQWFARVWHRARVPLPVETFTGRVNLYHATDFVLPPTLPRTRTLLTVHDLSFVRVPETASPSLKKYLDTVVPRSVAHADHVLADSQATKDDLVALYGVAEQKVTVLLSGVDPRFARVDVTDLMPALRAKYHIGDRPYIFSVGTVQPRKNYPRLIRALAALRAEGHDIGLVIAGGRGWLDDPIYSAIRSNTLAQYVHLIGFADDEDLPALYSGATAFAFPSLYEGFGLPILEAFGCGTPVVTANVSSLPEVAGDTALMIDPTDTEALTDALRQLLQDSALRQRLIIGGLERVKQFSWDAAAQNLKSIYSSLL